MTIEELRDFLWAENSAQVSNILDSVYTRLGLNPPANGFIAPKVQVMTIHGSKGLEADVVFIPGLEKNILPGDRRIPFPGLVLEAARMLYVSITRAKAACILSFADYRRINGVNTRQTPSQFTVRLGGRFVPRQSGLTAQETIDIIQSCINL
jgi:superfamily I DNA/RNA helicase